jgi:guanylate kinase
MIISLTGPSGAGKEHLKKTLLQRFVSLKELCWTTTRPLRPEESQGVTRESISRQEFDELVHAGEFRFVQHVFNNSYGIRKHFLRTESGFFLTEFHIENLILAHSQELYPVTIGLIPQSIKFLKERLKRRGTESAEEIADRLSSAKKEVSLINQHRHLFSLLVKFSGANEHTVADTVSEFLKPQITPATS